MRKLSRLGSFSLVMVTLFCGLATSEASLGSAPNTARQVPRVETYVPRGAPLTFGHASFKKEGGRDMLSYSFTNSAKRRLDTVQLVALFLDASGEVKGGQGWAVNMGGTTGASAKGSIELKARLEPTDYVLLTVRKADGGSINFTKAPADTLKEYRRSKGVAALQALP